ncbi:MAG TPA: hypothetical protein VHG70_11395 [Nocardioidaceae bacterium]|nr:hypothetical protein [Nocardioidaceae bacterium]
MKRYLVAAGVGTLVFGGVLGSASALDINDPGVAQYGQAMDLVCDENGVNIDGYFLDTDADEPSLSNGVVISNIAAACDGKTIVASVFDNAGDGLARGFVTLDDSGTATVKYNGGTQVPVSQIKGVRLTIG